MSRVEVAPISPPMVLGEGPHWHEKDQVLTFIDHPGGTVNRIYTQTGRHQVLNIEGSGGGIGPSMLIPVDGGEEDLFVVGLGHDMSLLRWRPEERDNAQIKPTILQSFDLDHPLNALNDAKCDPSGRLWAGTKGYESPDGILDSKKGSLYRIDETGESTKQVEEVTLSNGLTWSNDGKIFYYIDTPTLRVDAFDFDDKSGTITNRRVVFDLEKNGFDQHYPDGMTIDLDGNLWIACYNGAKILNVDPASGKLLRSVEIPSLYTTSCCFGGPDYATLYVTSATRGLSEDQIRLKPDSGKTFAVTGLQVKGSPHTNFKLDPVVVAAKFSC